MDMKGYKPRLIEQKLDDYLKAFGAVCIEGPKWCGKTWCALSRAKSTFMIGDSENGFQNRNLAIEAPKEILKGDIPRLIDEWQEVPSLWDAVKFYVDESNDCGKIILTGSSTPKYKGILHSGAGRIGKLKMSTMSLYESGDSTGDISLKDICYNKAPNKMTGEVDLRNLINLTIRGGWPGNIDKDEKIAPLLPKEYINVLLENDLQRMDGVKRDINKMRLLLKSLARNESTTVSINKLRDDISVDAGEVIDTATISAYLDVFSRCFLLENQPPYACNIKSSIRIKQMEKRHFCDPSLACALLGVNTDMLLNDFDTYGLLFEAMVERDLKIYAETFNAKLYHYQDYANGEADAVIELEDGNWCAFEIKVGASKIEEGAQSLLKLNNSIKERLEQYESASKSQKKKLKEEKLKPASVLCVISGLSSAAYKRSDGVYVVPITALKN